MITLRMGLLRAGIWAITFWLLFFGRRRDKKGKVLDSRIKAMKANKARKNPGFGRLGKIRAATMKSRSMMPKTQEKEETALNCSSIRFSFDRPSSVFM